MKKLEQFDEEDKAVLADYVESHEDLLDNVDEWALLIQAIYDEWRGGKFDYKLQSIIYPFLTEGMGQENFLPDLGSMQVDKKAIDKMFDIDPRDLRQINDVWEFQDWWYNENKHDLSYIGPDQFCVDLANVLPNVDKEKVFIWYLWDLDTSDFDDTLEFLLSELNLYMPYLER